MSRVQIFVSCDGGRPYVPRGRARYTPRLLDDTPERIAAFCEVVMEREFCDRWWLVECENAEAGRATIDFNGYCGDACGSLKCESDGCRMKGGRILASGGKP